MKKEDLRIRALLDRYYDGETALSEEKELAEYFSSNADLPEDLRSAKEMFDFFADEAQTTYEPQKKVRKRNKRHVLWAAAAVAALLVVAVCVRWSLSDKQEEPVYCYVNGKPITDKELAVTEIRNALNMVSVNIDANENCKHAMNEVNKSLVKINEAKNIIRLLTDNIN